MLAILKARLPQAGPSLRTSISGIWLRAWLIGVYNTEYAEMRPNHCYCLL